MTLVRLELVEDKRYVRKPYVLVNPDQVASILEGPDGTFFLTMANDTSLDAEPLHIKHVPYEWSNNAEWRGRRNYGGT